MSIVKFKMKNTQSPKLKYLNKSGKNDIKMNSDSAKKMQTMLTQQPQQAKTEIKTEMKTERRK